jgi:hypothetical protein
MIDSLYVNQTALREVKVNTSAEELLCQQGYIEMVGVIACDITATEYLIQCLGKLLESGFVLHILVLDTSQFLDYCGDRLLWVNQMISPFLLTIRIYFDIGYLNDTVLDKVKARGLQIKYDEWFL